jgi:hypothetical protein
MGGRKSPVKANNSTSEPRDREPEADALAERIDYCFRIAGGVRSVSKATGFPESLLYRYRKSGAQRRVNVLEAIARASGVEKIWLLTGLSGHQVTATETQLRSTSRPVYNSAAEAPYIVASDYVMDAAARSKGISGAPISRQFEFLHTETRRLWAECGRLAGEIAELKTKRKTHP